MTTSSERTTLYLRNVPTKLVREAKARAARDGKTLTRFVTDSLARAVRGPDEADALDAAFAADTRWFEENRARLSRRYRGEYVAIVDEAVIDHDVDFDALASRVFERVGTRSIFIPRAEAEPTEARIRSPRLVHR
jgi:hypothetical protein